MSLPFNFAKISKGRHFTVSGSKNLKLSLDSPFHNSFQKNVLASWLLFSFCCYKVLVSYVNRTEIARLTVCIFYNSWTFYFKFSEMINVSQDIWLIKNQKIFAFFILETKGAKNDKSFSFLKGRFSVMGARGPMDMTFALFSETNVRLLKSIISHFFFKI